MTAIWQNVPAGLVVGVLIGATGVGGGSLMTPLLVLLLGVAPHTAVGTDLLYASITKIGGVSVHSVNGRVDWQIVRRLALGSLPAAVITLLWLRWSDSPGVRDGAIIVGVGIALIVTSVAMIFKPALSRMGRRSRLTNPDGFKRYQRALTLLAGAVLGVLVTLTSIGAGALGAVMLLFLYPLRLVPVKLVATDLAHAIPLGLAAGIGHLILGNIDFVLLGELLIGSLPGVWIGAHFGGRLPDAVLRVCLAVILGAVGLKMIL